MLEKNKRRATRRKRNMVAKVMKETKRGGPMDDKRKKLLDEQEKKMTKRELERLAEQKEDFDEMCKKENDKCGE